MECDTGGYINFEDDFDEPPKPSWFRSIGFLIAIIIVGLMVAIPVIQIWVLLDPPASREMETSRRESTALLFTRGILELRSTRRGAAVALPELYNDVDQIVTGLQRKEPADFIGARAAIRRISCDAFTSDVEECFEAWLSRHDGSRITTVRFGVAIVDDKALVVEIIGAGILI